MVRCPLCRCAPLPSSPEPSHHQLLCARAAPSPDPSSPATATTGSAVLEPHRCRIHRPRPPPPSDPPSWSHVTPPPGKAASPHNPSCPPPPASLHPPLLAPSARSAVGSVVLGPTARRRRQRHRLHFGGAEALRLPARRHHDDPLLQGLLRRADALRHPLPARLAPGRACSCGRTTASAMSACGWTTGPVSLSSSRPATLGTSHSSQVARQSPPRCSDSCY